MTLPMRIDVFLRFGAGVGDFIGADADGLTILFVEIGHDLVVVAGQ